jgi:ABC-type multidrug transport system fused ATPase/permease subunit
VRLQAAFYPTLTFCFGLSGLIVLWLGGRDVIAHRLTLGEFVAFSRYLVLLSWPVIAFGWVINIVQRGVASWERMLEVLDAGEGSGVLGSGRTVFEPEPELASSQGFGQPNQAEAPQPSLRTRTPNPSPLSAASNSVTSLSATQVRPR